jgi:hypothetical protein
VQLNQAADVDEILELLAWHFASSTKMGVRLFTNHVSVLISIVTIW